MGLFFNHNNNMNTLVIKVRFETELKEVTPKSVLFVIANKKFKLI